MGCSMSDKQTRFSTGMGKIVLGLMALMAMYLMVHDEADCTTIGLCDYSQHCSDGMMCPEGSCAFVAADGYCEPWQNRYGEMIFIGYYRRYDCDDTSCDCQAVCGIDMCGAPSKGECLEIIGGHFEYPSLWAYCDVGGEGGFPPRPCDDGDVCCLPSAPPVPPTPPVPPSPPPSGGNDMGHPLYSENGPNPKPSSPTPKFNFHYDYKYKVDRGMGMGWSHTYTYSLEEDPQTGNVIAYKETGGFPWTYYANGDGTYEAAPYDRSVLEKTGDTFTSTLRDGTKYMYNPDGQLDSIEDSNFNGLTMKYDPNGQLEEVADDFGRSLQLTYYAHGHLESVTDPNGNRYTFIYQESGPGSYNLVTVQYPDGTQKRFEYNDSNDPHNLTRIIDNNNNIAARYKYDRQGRIISTSRISGANAVEIDYRPAIGIFSDDFQEGMGPDWSNITGTVEVVGDPDQELYGDKVAHIQSGSMTCEFTEAMEGLKVSFDLWISEENTEAFWLKILNNTEGEDFGPWIRFTPDDIVQAELIYEGSAHRIGFARELSKNQWHRVEIEADAREFYTYFKIWIDCEYMGGHPFKRDTDELDSIMLDARTSGNDLYIDNFQLEEITMDGSKQIKKDEKGGREVLTIMQNNEFGGQSWQIVTTGKLDEGCQSCSSSKLYEYDGKWNLRRIVDANEIAIEMTYDDRGNMLSRAEAVGTTLERTTTWSWHPDFNKVIIETVKSVDTPGQNKVTTYSYDSNGNVLSETITGYSNGIPFSHMTTYFYNTRGQVIEIDRPRNDIPDVTTFDYHPDKGYITSITYPNGTVTYSGYDANHNVGTMIDLNGITTSYTYDDADRIETITVGSAVTEYDYDPVGNIDYVRMPEGNIIDYEYDESNRLIKITDDLGNYIVYGYDSLGNKIREEYHDDSGMLKKFLDFDYDPFNRLKIIKNPDNSFTEFSYDSNGNLRKRIDPLGIETEYAYDALNRLIKVTQAKSATEEAVTEYGYDSQDNLIWVQDAEARVTTYRYDDRGRLIETISPNTGTTTRAFDESGNLISKTDANYVIINYEYDALNRLTKIDFPDDQDMVYTYDEMDVAYGRGKLTRMQDGSGTTRYAYDERGNIIEQRVTINGTTYVTRYTYNLNNQATQISYPSGRVVTYSINDVGNITDVFIDGLTIISGMTYEPFGGLKEMQFALSSLQTTVNRDSRYQIKSIQAGNIVNRTYTHDFNGNIKSIKQNDSLPYPIILTGTDTYAYEQGKDWINDINTPDNTYSYTYGANGHIISNGVFTCEYNQWDRLKRVVKDGILGEYTYNGKGQRVKKLAGGITTIYHYDLAGNLIAETEENGNLIADYIYAGSERVGKVEPDGNLYYYHNDHLGTPIGMTDDNGIVVWKAAYRPFGRAEVHESSTIENNFRFPGQYFDQETGLHYNWYRYYDPRIGRYLSADPIGIWGDIKINPNLLQKKHLHIESLKMHLIGNAKHNIKLLQNNLYIYGLNNPLLIFDFLGLNAITNPQSKDDLIFYWGNWKTHTKDCYDKDHCDLMFSGCNLNCQDLYQDNYIALGICVTYCLVDYSFCLRGAQ